MLSAILGGILGSTMGFLTGYQTKRSNDAQKELAERQFELQKRQAQEEEQARNKLNQKEVDVEGLLSDNTATGLGENILSGLGSFNSNKNTLNKKNNLLGG